MSVDLIIQQVFGQRAALVMPTIPDDAPDDIREGLARRRIVMTTGSCPCGARLIGPNREQRRQMTRDRERGRGALWQVTIFHEDDCPALDSTLIEALQRWRR